MESGRATSGTSPRPGHPLASGVGRLQGGGQEVAPPRDGDQQPGSELQREREVW